MPKNVGPPPISPTSSRKPHDGRSSLVANGPTMPKPSVALCRPKPMTEHQRQADLPGRRRLPDREALGEVVQPDAGGDHQRERLGRREHAHHPGTRRLRLDRDGGADAVRTARRAAAVRSARRSTRGSSGRRRPPPSSTASHANRPQPPSWSTAAAVRADSTGSTPAARTSSRNGGSGRRRCQERVRRDRKPTHPADGEADEDGEAGDRAEDEDLGLDMCARFLTMGVRLSLRRRRL